MDFSPLNLNGFLVVDKPIGPTSAGVVGRLKWLLKNHAGAPKNIKIGHGGTLDPFATGVLPIGVGRGTKGLQALLNGPKTYTFTLALGQATATGDATGTPTASAPVPPLAALQAALPAALVGLTGPIIQTPPAFSALKVNGQRAYSLARAGQAVTLAPRPVEVYELTVESLTVQALVGTATVSKGTYIRTLGEDLARALGTVGHLTALRRKVHGGFSIAQAVAFETLDKALQTGHWQAYLLPLDAPPACN
jgi:tRNA pseudouridine55 synthase